MCVLPSNPAGAGLRWLDFAVGCGNASAALSRRVGLGGGSIIGGRVTLALYPSALNKLTVGRRVIIVSGTNGKTTTSHMLAAALGTCEHVAHNQSGSNMADGAVAALAADRQASTAVLEIDELCLAGVVARSAPAAIVLLNLSRDQLDRSAEVRRTSAAIGGALAKLPGTTVFANCDDPMTVSAARCASGPIVWFAAGSGWREDSSSCPSCGCALDGIGSQWACACGFVRPHPSWRSYAGAAHGPHGSTAMAVSLPGSVNRSNALAALAVATGVGVQPDVAACAISRVDEVAGRYSTVRVNGRIVRLLLAKNPAGWAATLEMIDEPRPLVIAINAREADGRDTSWLWDVDFGSLHGREVVASGERAADLGVRLSYAGLSHRTAPDPLMALNMLPTGEVDMVANYTAFHALTRWSTVADRHR